MSRKFSPGSCRLPLMGSALALALAVGDVHALGLGGLRIQSALNQPFVGEIALLDVKPDELDAVKVQIASAEEFSRAGSERYHYLSRLRFNPQISPRGEAVIRVSSRDPIREPYMDLLLEVTWPNGRLVKGYTVLLDPPVTDGRRPSRIEPPVVEPRGVVAAARPDSGAAAAALPPRQRQAPPPPAVVQPMPVPAELAASAGGFPKYIGPVARGAGLWRLAVNNAPAGATAAQTAMALYRNNQGAFVNGNINRLTVGKTLVIPNAAELFALGPEAAEREFAAALRGEKVRRSPIADPTPPGTETESRLKIAGTAPDDRTPGAVAVPATEGPQAMEQELLLVREASESTRQETAELRDRIRELESQLGEIQQLLRLRNAELARIQGAATPAVAPPPGQVEGEAPVLTDAPEVAGPMGEEASPVAARPLDPAGGQPLEQALVDSDARVVPQEESPTEPATPGPIETLELPIPVAGSESRLEEPGPLPADQRTAPEGETPAEGRAPSQEAVQDTGESPSARPIAEPEPGTPLAEASSPVAAEVRPGVASPEASEGAEAGLPLPWGDLLVPLAGAAGVSVLGIGALAWVRARRRRASAESYLEPEDLELAPQAKPAAPAARGAARLAPAESAQGSGDTIGSGPGPVTPGAVPPPSVFSSLSRSQAESDEADVLSEADIYIAYGRYREAEELLREEIQRTPERIDLKYKLAESYHGARNYPALDALMNEMQGAGEDRVDPDRWQRLVDMAKAIEGLERADAGVRPAAVRAAPAALGLVGGPRSGEALSLDISDAKGRAGIFGFPGDLDDDLASAGDPSQRDVPVLRSSRPALPADDDLEPLSLDLDVLPHSLDLDTQLHAAGLDAPLEQEESDFIGAVSDLELTIDDLRAASDLDLESFVDSTRTVSKLVDEPLSRQEQTTDPGGLGSRPARLRAVSGEGGGFGNDMEANGSLYGPDEGGSSDLLSSQWQMDSGLWDETATKLDLARAYVEMGDQDSARAILEEVANEGNAEQRGEAAEMLRALG